MRVVFAQGVGRGETYWLVGAYYLQLKSWDVMVVRLFTSRLGSSRLWRRVEFESLG